MSFKFRLILNFVVYLFLTCLALVPVSFAQDVSSETATMTQEEVNFEVDSEKSYEKSFVCSAYYSPLPGQGYYVTGSYAGDIRLNGGGVRGASGMPVFPGMVAAPPNFPFGTKMYIPGIGMTTVADRGGAIKGSRLDIWFGHGEEALRRALQFGKRPCLVTVYGLDNTIPNAVNFPNTEANIKFGKLAEDPFKFDSPLKLGSKGESVARLQQFLKDMGYFIGQVDANYDEKTEMAVKKFQIDQGALEAPSIEIPGNFGATTIGKIELVLASGREKYWQRVPSRNMGRGAGGEEVRRLQEALILLGYDVDVNSIYDNKTVEAVYNFQIQKGLIKDKTDTAAGYFGPKTQMTLDSSLAELEELPLSETENKANLQEKTDSQLNYNSQSLGNASKFLGLSEGMSSDEVKELQTLLKGLNFLRVEPTGYYGPLTAHAVFKLKQKLGFVSNESDLNTGKVDSRLAKYLDDLYLNKGNESAQLTLILESKWESLANVRNLSLGMRGKEVRLLQEFLKEKGYFPGAYTTEYFGEVTKSALIDFQLDFALISSPAAVNAGIFDDVVRNLIRITG